MFGLSFSEMLIIALVGIVVLGPRRLPAMMRTAGQWVAKLRRLSTELRTQSGIDDLIKQEGLENEIQELRSLSRINVIDTLITPAGAAGAATAARATVNAPRLEAKATVPRSQPLRHREYPLVGCDAYGALADDIPPRTPAPPIPKEAAPPAEPVKDAEAVKDVEDAPVKDVEDAPAAEATAASGAAGPASAPAGAAKESA